MKPADDKQLAVASILYYQLFEKELPKLDYNKQDIQYIIEQLSQNQGKEANIFSSGPIH